VRRSLHCAEFAPLEPADQIRIGCVAAPAPERFEGHVAGRLASVARVARDGAERSKIEPEPPRICFALLEEVHARPSPAIGREENRLAEVAESIRVEPVRGEGVGHAPACLDHRQACRRPDRQVAVEGDDYGGPRAAPVDVGGQIRPCCCWIAGVEVGPVPETEKMSSPSLGSSGRKASPNSVS
jgi:hypothetical protein